MRTICVVLLAGLASACGNSAEREPADAAATQGDTAKNVEAGMSADKAGGELTEGARQTAAALADAAAEPSPGSGVQTGSAATLPFPLGFYVTSDIACSEASNATLQLLRRDGINTSRVPCDFDSVIMTGATTYRVTETCTEGGEAWGTEEHVSTNTSIYEMLSATSFRVVGDGWESTMKYCPQSQLPEPWRDNDISDIVG